MAVEVEYRLNTDDVQNLVIRLNLFTRIDCSYPFDNTQNSVFCLANLKTSKQSFAKAKQTLHVSTSGRSAWLVPGILNLKADKIQSGAADADIDTPTKTG